MAKHGLGQIDLNLGASLALRGLSDTPEADIARLLRSGQPIEDYLRNKLADALEGKSSTIHLKATGKAKTKGFRAFRLRLFRIAQGLDAIEKKPVLGYEKAVEALAARDGCSEKTVMASIAIARDVEEWKEKIRTNHSEFAHLENDHLRVAVAYSDANGRDVLDILSNKIDELTDLVKLSETWFKDAGKPSNLKSLKA